MESVVEDSPAEPVRESIVEDSPTEPRTDSLALVSSRQVAEEAMEDPNDAPDPWTFVLQKPSGTPSKQQRATVLRDILIHVRGFGHWRNGVIKVGQEFVEEEKSWTHTNWYVSHVTVVASRMSHVVLLCCCTVVVSHFFSCSMFCFITICSSVAWTAQPKAGYKKSQLEDLRALISGLLRSLLAGRPIRINFGQRWENRLIQQWFGIKRVPPINKERTDAQINSAKWNDSKKKLYGPVDRVDRGGRRERGRGRRQTE